MTTVMINDDVNALVNMELNIMPISDHTTANRRAGMDFGTRSPYLVKKLKTIKLTKPRQLKVVPSTLLVSIATENVIKILTPG